jgi:hypothetical protein
MVTLTTKLNTNIQYIFTILVDTIPYLSHSLTAAIAGWFVEYLMTLINCSTYVYLALNEKTGGL